MVEAVIGDKEQRLMADLGCCRSVKDGSCCGESTTKEKKARGNCYGCDFSGEWGLCCEKGNGCVGEGMVAVTGGLSEGKRKRAGEMADGEESGAAGRSCGGE
ncbi:hypothetical protein OIU76_000723 [Salix suchowensis]|nr:hypothetical protein OIU76_000723 [Salix suchowensis]